MAKVKYSVEASMIDCDVYTNGRKIVLKSASQKELEFLYKKKYQGITTANEE